jgi:hypothetical protein
VGNTGVEEHTLGGRGLTRIDVGDDADISVSVNRGRTGHSRFTSAVV